MMKKFIEQVGMILIVLIVGFVICLELNEIVPYSGTLLMFFLVIPVFVISSKEPYVTIRLYLEKRKNAKD